MAQAVNRRDFMKGMGMAAAGMMMSGQAAARPNVILVMTDDQGYGDLACHGNPVLKTPNLDRLHGESLRLTDFHVCPTCAPTRGALMTGRYSIRTGIWHTIMGRSLLRADETTMADVFKANGYRTGFAGKWHLGDNWPCRPQDRGFEEVLMHGGGGVGQVPDYWGNDYFDDTYFRNGKAEKQQGYCTDVWFDECLRFLEAHRREPFFFYLPTNAPHSPYNVSEKYSALYEGKEGVVNPDFNGMITNIDENMGRLMQRLDVLGLAENTILIFMTDNGTAAGVQRGHDQHVTKGFGAGMRGAKGTPWEGGHRVPCFIRWPAAGMTGGRDIGRLTAHIDLLPTLIDLCGMKAPETAAFDGTSLTALLKDADAAWPDRTIFVDQQRIAHPQKWRNSCVMTAEWRLIFGKELYNIRKDPGQNKNVADEFPEVTQKLRVAYEAWWKEVSKRFDEYCHIPLGHEKANPTVLCAMDWHGDKVPWNQPHIREGMVANGKWAVDVTRAGKYEIGLHRWPVETGAALNTAIDGGKALNLETARLQIGGIDARMEVEGDAPAAVFRLRLPEGETFLQTWLIDADGVERGAYNVMVRRVPG
jgi:arylsulfatase A-like enzyme